MRRWLFLRSAHRDGLDGDGPDPILSVYDDMWCGLFSTIVITDHGMGQIWKLGTDHWETHHDSPWITCFRSPDLIRSADFYPEIVFNRGGYAAYQGAIEKLRLQMARMVYYGAGTRTFPIEIEGEFGLGLILVDSLGQLKEGREKYAKSRVEIIHKPACEHLFFPIDMGKDFDIVFSSRRAVEFKGHQWLCERLPKGTRVLRIGDPDPWFKLAEANGQLNVTWTGRIDPAYVPAQACKAKMAAVVDDGTKDSGPRVLPEYLAMNIPVIVRDTVRCDLNAYVTEQSGIVVGDEDFGDAYGRVIVRTDWAPRDHYDQNFTMEHAAKEILSYVG